MSRKDNEKKETKPRKTEETSIGREIWEYVKMIAIVVAVVVFVEQVIVINARIPSPSMENTIMTGDQIFGNRLAYVKSDPQRYDIVIFYYPDDEKQKFIKRVIGLPGETVTIRDGKVYINDSTEPLRDDFCPETPVGDFGPYEVPEGCDSWGYLNHLCSIKGFPLLAESVRRERQDHRQGLSALLAAEQNFSD